MRRGVWRRVYKENGRLRVVTPFVRGAVALRHQAAAREPAKERTERDPRLRCKGDIGGQTDDNAERQAQHGSKPDGHADAHVRECMTAAR
jgi:hypothetical protein